MKKFLLNLIIGLCLFGTAQSQIEGFCPIQKEYLRFDNTDNLPTVDANDDGTVTLTFSDPAINAILANHIVYDFYQKYPNNSGVLGTYYALDYQNKDLIVELYSQASQDLFEFSYDIDSEYGTITFDPVLIDFLDAKQMKITQYYYDTLGECVECPFEDVPDDFDLTLKFLYNESTDMLTIKTDGSTPYENTFDIGLKTQDVDYHSLILWSSFPSEQENSVPYGSVEDYLYNIFNLSCSERGVGAIRMSIDEDENSLIVYRGSATFGRYVLKLQDNSLSTTLSNLSNTDVVYDYKKSQIQVKTNASNLDLELFSVSGQKLMEKSTSDNDIIHLDFISAGIYFIRTSDREGITQTFKIVKS